MRKSDYITTAELAKMLGISRVAVFKKIKDGEIKAIAMGRNYVIEKDTLPLEIRDRIQTEKRQIVEQVIELGQKDKKDVGFEKELWKAADRLRGHIDVSEYKHIVLGLLFLKYVSDLFYQRRKQLEQWVSDSK